MSHHIILLGYRIRYVAIAILLQLKDLRVNQWIKLCIRINTRELNKNSVQDCLPYIPKINSLCSTTLAYPK